MAIILAGIFIAAAVYFTGNNKKPSHPIPESPPTADIGVLKNTDHIRGNPNAPIVIIEYLDYNCPHCRSFHQTMNRIMDNYGVTGKVAWVARHLPLKDLYPNSPRLALGAECVDSIAGNTAFWKFSDLIFNNRAGSEPADVSRLSEFAETAGVSQADFENCLEAGTFEAKVEADFKAALADGAEGTPYIILVAGNQKEVIKTDISYRFVAGAIDELLKQIEGRSTNSNR